MISNEISAVINLIFFAISPIINFTFSIISPNIPAIMKHRHITISATGTIKTINNLRSFFIFI